MTNDLYTDFVAVRMKGGEDIHASLTPGKCDLLHGAIGVAGEAGEFLDAVKKHVIYGQPLNLENAIEELGDIEFYLQAVRNSLGIPPRVHHSEERRKAPKTLPRSIFRREGPKQG